MQSKNGIKAQHGLQSERSIDPADNHLLKSQLLKTQWKRSGLIKSFSRACIFALPVILLWQGCQQPTAPLPEITTASTPVILSSGDVIKLTFPGASELNQSQKIRTDGKVNLPLIGEVDAAGKSVPSLQSELAQRFKSELKTSTVIVTLESSVSEVVVSGAVSKPSKLTFDRPTTVFQAIMEAGGVSEYGTLRNVHLIRLVNGEEHTQVLDLRRTMSGQKTRPYYVKDGDVIFVQRTVF